MSVLGSQRKWNWVSRIIRTGVWNNQDDPSLLSASFCAYVPFFFKFWSQFLWNIPGFLIKTVLPSYFSLIWASNSCNQKSPVIHHLITESWLITIMHCIFTFLTWVFTTCQVMQLFKSYYVNKMWINNHQLHEDSLTIPVKNSLSFPVLLKNSLFCLQPMAHIPPFLCSYHFIYYKFCLVVVYASQELLGCKQRPN